MKKEFQDLELICDRKVDDGCSRRRPDIRIECFTHNIIVECDENEHKGYNCEGKRIMEIFQDLGSRPLIVIRFNPDSYAEDDTKISSAFTTTKAGWLALNRTEWKWRVKELKRTIRNSLRDVPVQDLTTIQLFYTI